MLVRHGRTAWNAGGRYQGQSDIPLDDTGRAQAAALGRTLADLKFDVAVSSDLARARETAGILLGSRVVELETDVRWREMDFGAWEGLTRAQIVARTPALRNSDAPPRSVTPDGGESFSELCVRIAAALATVRERTPAGGRALVVTHAGPLHAVLRELLGETAASALAVTFTPASFTTFDVGASGARLDIVNRTTE